MNGRRCFDCRKPMKKYSYFLRRDVWLCEKCFWKNPFETYKETWDGSQFSVTAEQVERYRLALGMRRKTARAEWRGALPEELKK